MKILNISNNDYDGAGKAVLRLNNSLNKLGIKSKFLVLYKNKDNKNTIAIGTGKSLREILKQILRSYLFVKFDLYRDFCLLLKCKIINLMNNLYYRPKNLFNFYNIPFNFNYLIPHIVEADVIILHSIQDLLKIENINYIHNKLKKKIIIHPLDMEIITGGYHFSFDCKCYITGMCNSKHHNCDFLAKKNYQKKIEILGKIPITWMASNKYVLKRILSSKIYSKKYHKSEVVYFGIEKQRYSYVSKKLSRKKLRISDNRKVLLFGCSNFNDPRKGAYVVNKVIERLSKSRIKSDKILLLTYGEINNFKIKSKNIKWLHLGTIESDYRMNLIYRSSDIMLNPSFDDLGPTTLQEAFLNNLYIVSFDLGLASDLIINNYNGNIVKNFDTDKFYQAVYKFILNRKSINKNISSQKTIKNLKKLCFEDSEAKYLLKLLTG